MFNPKLKETSDTRLTYATPLGFRLMFLAIAVFIAGSSAAAAVEPFYRWPPMLFGIIVLCLLSAAYLERWVFDTADGAMERHLGLLFWHSRRRTPLSELTRLTFREPGLSFDERPKMVQAVTRRAAIVAIEDRSGNAFPLDMVKGANIGETRKLAERIASFCGIPLEDTVADEHDASVDAMTGTSTDPSTAPPPATPPADTPREE